MSTLYDLAPTFLRMFARGLLCFIAIMGCAGKQDTLSKKRDTFDSNVFTDYSERSERILASIETKGPHDPDVIQFLQESFEDDRFEVAMWCPTILKACAEKVPEFGNMNSAMLTAKIGSNCDPAIRSNYLMQLYIQLCNPGSRLANESSSQTLDNTILARIDEQKALTDLQKRHIESAATNHEFDLLFRVVGRLLHDSDRDGKWIRSLVYKMVRSSSGNERLFWSVVLMSSNS